MKPFRFPLQALLTLRERQEQLALKAYAQAIRQRQTAEEQLASAGRHLDSLWSQWSEELLQNPVAAHLDQLRRCCESAVQSRAECQKSLAAASRIVHKAWERLVVIRQQREAVENYYHKLQREHHQAVQKEEQKLIDDLAQRCGMDLALQMESDKRIWN